MPRGANIGYEEEMIFEEIMDQDSKRADKSHQTSNIYLSEGGIKRRTIAENSNAKE